MLHLTVSLFGGGESEGGGVEGGRPMVRPLVDVANKMAGSRDVGVESGWPPRRPLSDEGTYSTRTRS